MLFKNTIKLLSTGFELGLTKQVLRQLTTSLQLQFIS